MSEQRRALILGGTGLIGGHCLRFLQDDPHYAHVTALLRRPLSHSHEKVTERLVNFDRLEDYRDQFVVDDIYCCLGTTIRSAGSRQAFRRVDFDYPLEAARLGADSGAKSYLIVSALGADPHASAFYSRVKGETEEAVRKVQYSSLRIFRPSMLLGERKDFRLFEVLLTPVMRCLAFAMVGSWAKYRPISAEVVAAAMVRVAHDESHGVQVFESDHIQKIGGDGTRARIIGRKSE